MLRWPTVSLYRPPLLPANAGLPLIIPGGMVSVYRSLSTTLTQAAKTASRGGGVILRTRIHGFRGKIRNDLVAELQFLGLFSQCIQRSLTPGISPSSVQQQVSEVDASMRSCLVVRDNASFQQ